LHRNSQRVHFPLFKKLMPIKENCSKPLWVTFWMSSNHITKDLGLFICSWDIWFVALKVLGLPSIEKNFILNNSWWVNQSINFQNRSFFFHSSYLQSKFFEPKNEIETWWRCTLEFWNLIPYVKIVLIHQL